MENYEIQEERMPRMEFAKKFHRALNDSIKIVTGELPRNNDIDEQLKIWQSWADEVEREQRDKSRQVQRIQADLSCRNRA